MEIQFKDLTVDSLFDFCTVIDAVGVKEILYIFSVDELRSLSDPDSEARNIGVLVTMKICGIVIKGIPKAKDEICTFMANCMIYENGTAVTVEDVKKLKLAPFMKLLREFFKKDDLADFFTEVVEFLDMAGVSSANSSSEDTATQNSI
ncbi:MAG: hypothetical protein LUF04_02020 [Bacteroides sp.]|nr:hypothetical protein [Bacteroides sp.]